MILLRSVVSKEPALLFMFWRFIVEKLALLELLTHVRNVFSGLVLAGTQLRMEQSATVAAVDRRGLLVLGRCFDFWTTLHHQQFQNCNQHEKNKLETQSLAAFTLSRFIEARCLPLFCGETTCPSLFTYREFRVSRVHHFNLYKRNTSGQSGSVNVTLAYLRHFHPNSPLRLCSQHVWKYNIAVSGLLLPCNVTRQGVANFQFHPCWARKTINRS